MTSRREFLKHTAGAGLGAAALGRFPFSGLGEAPAVHPSAVRPVAIASSNGLRAVNRAMEIILTEGDTLEAVVRGVNINELDPEDYTVGYGGLPNAEGVVQLDSSVMHGPSRDAGAVAALAGVKTPSLVAVAIMRYTDHVFLVGEGAREFAREMGFEIHEELLTPYSRQRWLEWRAELSERDDWILPEEPPELLEDIVGPVAEGEPRALLDSRDGHRPWGTINCDAVGRDGNLSGVTTTSGLFFKVPGRVGDSPIIGAGLYVDNDVGAAGATGRGEAVIKTAGSHTVIENMRHGMDPTDACLDALRRIVHWTAEGGEDRLLLPDGRPAFNVTYYATNKRGEYGAAAIWAGHRYAVNVAGRGRIEDAAYLFAETPS